jgi:hypothetical protein
MWIPQVMGLNQVSVHYRLVLEHKVQYWAYMGRDQCEIGRNSLLQSFTCDSFGENCGNKVKSPNLWEDSSLIHLKMVEKRINGVNLQVAELIFSWEIEIHVLMVTKKLENWCSILTLEWVKNSRCIDEEIWEELSKF